MSTDLLSSCPTQADLARQMLAESSERFGDEEREILEDIADGKPSARRADAFSLTTSSLGERLADRVAAVGGSWRFIIFFGVVLFGWMFLNGGLPQSLGLRFDPYPFIFLNLMLSTLAAVQAPVIMMSQNRQAAKDRIASQLDFETNIRAELDILRLHYKLDAILAHRIDALGQRIDEQQRDG